MVAYETAQGRAQKSQTKKINERRESCSDSERIIRENAGLPALSRATFLGARGFSAKDLPEQKPVHLRAQKSREPGTLRSLRLAGLTWATIRLVGLLASAYPRRQFLTLFHATSTRKGGQALFQIHTVEDREGKVGYTKWFSIRQGTWFDVILTRGPTGFLDCAWCLLRC